jgi:uncharacterized protein
MNRLSRASSPYLLQHASNPVDWYEWGDEAFAAARRDNKPIFLSVGYSTCHWCHVMAHESFEDAGVARVLNEQFVAVKVDREERPDIDRIYMAFVQATTGGGGWPMSVWLTPDLRPFYGGTYFPPSSRWGRPGFVEILNELARLWRDERTRVMTAAAGVGERLAAAQASVGAVDVPGTGALRDAVDDLLESHDRRHGGFGGAPKFPRPAELLFLLREHRRTGAAEPLEAVAFTLRAMAAGGMRDHVGGGFHRYSVDAQWRVPHFEKMLYDQAQLVLAYLEAGQASGDRAFIDVAEDTLRYVQRDLTDEAGGFYSAEDADSLPPGDPENGHKAEGAFYIWSSSELDHVLGPDAEAFRERFGVYPDGNALNDPQGEFTGRNILYQAQSIEAVANVVGQPVEAMRSSLERARVRLHQVRSDRPRPALDDKVLTAWNGLMIAAFARASRVISALVSEPYLISAQRAASFIRSRLWDASSGRLLRRYRRGDAGIDAYAEDYACLVFGLIELFQADGDVSWLDWAIDLQQRLDTLFFDADLGGWFATTGTDASLVMRLKEDYDGAEPSASSIAVCNLLALSALVPLEGAAERIERTLRLFAPRITSAPRAVPMMLTALSAWHAGMAELVLVGDETDAGLLALRREVDACYEPFVIVVPAGSSGAAREALARRLPALADMGRSDGVATAYLCRRFTCDAPTTDPVDLRRQLGRRG